MIHLQKLMLYLTRKRGPSSLPSNALKVPKYPVPWFRESGMDFRICRFYGKKAVRNENYLKGGETSTCNRGNVAKISRANLQDAQAVLAEYSHSTRGLDFTDADAISRHSPQFLQKLLEKVIDGEVDGWARSLALFLCYHPINEFEPFFESIGLEPSEYLPLLPRDFMHLNDDAHLLENYHVLCNYGVLRNGIGRIYKEAREVFGYGDGVLYSKLRAIEGLGLGQHDVIKAVSSHPHLLIDHCYKDFGTVLEKLKSFGFQYDCVERRLPETGVTNWRRIPELLRLFVDLGCNEEQLKSLINRQPGLLFDGSGGFAFSLVGFLVKLGFAGNDICSLFLELPENQAIKYVPNLKSAFHLLNEMEMDPADVERIFRLHSAWLGLCCLKKPATLLIHLRCGKKRACDIKENPLVLKNWVLGAKVSPLPSISEEVEMSKKQKAEFLVSLGLTEDSEEMRAAMKAFLGKGNELQDRFDCFVKAGLDPKDVSKMVKSAPRILNSSKQTIQGKIDCLVNELGYPISDLVAFPSFISYTTDRARLRHLMYKWLLGKGLAEPNLALSTLIACSDKTFVRIFVNSHPEGPQVWEELRKKMGDIA